MIYYKSSMRLPTEEEIKILTEKVRLYTPTDHEVEKIEKIEVVFTPTMGGIFKRKHKQCPECGSPLFSGEFTIHLKGNFHNFIKKSSTYGHCPNCSYSEAAELLGII